MLLTGRAYGRRATLELTGDSLIWRASRGDPPIAENIATTPHDVREARLVVSRWSPPGMLLGAAAALWMSTQSVLVGALPLAGGLALVAQRFARPTRYLVLDLGARTLVLDVPPTAAVDAQTLVDRCTNREPPASPPTLP